MNTIHHFTIMTTLALVMLSSCMETPSSEPEPPPEVPQPLEESTAPTPRSEQFTCDAIIRGEGETPSGLKMRYEIDQERKSYVLALLDDQGAVLATGESQQWDESKEISAARITLKDPGGVVQYQATARTSFVPGYGFETYSVRRVGDKVLHGRTLMTANPARDHYQIGVASSKEEATASWQGQHVLAFSYEDPEATVPVTQEALDSWLQAQGMKEAVGGEWSTRAAELFSAQAPWRSKAIEHWLFCQYGEDTQLRAVNVNEPSVQSKGLINAAVDPDCYEEQLKKRSAATGARLDRAKKVIDVLALAQKTANEDAVGIATGDLDKGGAGFEIDLGAGFKFKINGALMGSVVANVNLYIGKRATLASLGPVGVAILGAGVALDIAIIVNEAFGEDIHRALDKALGRAPKSAVEKPAEDLGYVTGGSNDAPASYSYSSPTSGSFLDPHLQTHDGLAYDFQATGDFILVQDLQGGFEIQTRQRPFDSICPGTAVNTRAAMRLGNDRLEYDGDWTINGEAVDVYEDGIALEQGRLFGSNSRFVLTTNAGDVVVFKGRSVISVGVGLAPTRRGRVRGLLGDGDGEGTERDELVLANGQALAGESIRWEDLIGPFAQSWRVTAQNSLFTYAQGEGPEDFITPGYPSRPTLLEDFEPSAVTMAIQTCRDAGVEGQNVLDDCALDTLCTPPNLLQEMVEGHVGREEPVAKTRMEFPVFLDKWTQQGVLSAGDWQVTEDGQGVSLSSAMDATFLVSEKDYGNHTLTGSMEVRSFGDDDVIGFVFGYKSPLAQANDDPKQLDTFVLGWKGKNDSGSPEGLTLSYINALVDDGLDYFWNHTKANVLAQEIGPGTRWGIQRRHDFILSYSKDRVRIFIDGQERFSLPASSAPGGSWPTGRFGFYNYSQDATRYTNFMAHEGPSDVLFFDYFDSEPEAQVATELQKWDILGGVEVSQSLSNGRAIRTGGISTRAPIKLEPGRYRFSAYVYPEGRVGDTSTIELGPMERVTINHTDKPQWGPISRTFEVTDTTEAKINVLANSPESPLWLDRVVLLKFD